MGNYRGGTTAVTQLLIEAGIYMGPKQDTNCEDPAFAVKDYFPETITKIGKVIKERNDMYEYWGFKFPGSYKFIDKLMPWLKRPHLIIVLRDPIAMQDSEARRAKVDYSLTHIMNRQRELMEAVDQFGVPKLFISYEHLLCKTHRVCTSLSRFLGTGDIIKMEQIIGQYSDYGTHSWDY